MNTNELEALFDILKEHNLKVKDFNEIVEFINKKIQEDKTK